MSHLRDFLREWKDWLDCASGHIMVGFVLLYTSAIFTHWKVPKAEDIAPFALGILARSMQGRNGEEQLKKALAEAEARAKKAEDALAARGA